MANDPPALNAPTGLRIAPMDAAGLDFAVAQHLEHFPVGFFAKLGPRFLSEYYRSFTRSPNAVALLADLDSEPIGYLVGALDAVEHRRQVVTDHGRRLVWLGLTGMCRRPGLALFFLRTRALRYSRRLLRRSAETTRQTSEAPAVLNYVVVSPSTRGLGVGSALLARFEDKAKAAGRNRLVLVTAAGADSAERFYLKEGWTRGGEHRASDGRRLVTFFKQLPHEATQEE